MAVLQDSASAADRLLAEYLRDTDAACPRCQYSLRGLTGAVCPECGDRLKLAVELVEPRLGAYITTLVAWSGGLGGSGLFNLLALTEAPREWWHSACARWLLILLTASAPALLGAVVFRRRLRRLDALQQWMVALGSCLIVVTMSVAIIATFDD